MDEILKHKEFTYLTQYQVESFMTHGYLRLKRCFTRKQAEDFTKDVWVRLGMNPNDKSTWHTEWTNMPGHGGVEVRDFAPKAWNAICELAGGEDRINYEWCSGWSDAFLVNLGTPEEEGKNRHPKELHGWHVDGDFFVHFLDSPEQGLLVIPCWTDVKPNGGATWICTDGPKRVGQWLYDHPQGVGPDMVPVGEEANEQTWDLFPNIIRSADDSALHEMTGDVGDVILLHPLMLHSASKNGRRLVRIITNPPISLKKPFNFSRQDPNEYSLIELKTIKDIGRENLANWGITGKRKKLHPEREQMQEKMYEEEQTRLGALQPTHNHPNGVSA